MPPTNCTRFLLAWNPPRPTTATFCLQLQRLRYATKKASKPTSGKKKVPLAAIIKPAAPQPPPSLKYFSLSESLGSSGKKSIMLYACNNRSFIMGCYTLATGMIAWSVYTFNTNISNKRPGIPRWVVTTTYVSVTVMMLMAGVIAYYPTRIIQIIHAHPIPGTARTPPSVSITLHKRPLFPTLPMRKIQVASPELITLGEPLQPIHVKAASPPLDDTRDAMTKIRHAITGAPFKTFDFFRKALSTSSFVALKVDGVGRFRISKDGWVWERRGLDRLFKTTR